MPQKKLADEVLAPRNIRAIFFIPTGFIGLSGEQAEKFAKTNFFPESNPPDLSPGSYDGPAGHVHRPPAPRPPSRPPD